MPSTPSDRSSFVPVNANTVMPERFSLPEIPRIQRALELAWRTVEAAPRVDAPGVHVFGVYGQTVVVQFLAASADDYFVFGRHLACDVILDADPSVSLRHLLARAIRLDDGSVALRLLDLMTPLPLVLADGSMQRSVVATGPFAVGIGAYVIGGIPTDVHRYETRGGPYRAPAPVDPAERLPRAALTEIPAWSGQGAARVTLSRGGRIVSTQLDEGTLENGVLIGRAGRCLDGGLRSVLSPSISRVHLMLLRDGAEDVAIDLGSTQGTYAQDVGGRLRMMRLPPRALLRLGYVDPVALVWDRPAGR